MLSDHLLVIPNANADIETTTSRSTGLGFLAAILIPICADVLPAATVTVGGTRGNIGPSVLSHNNILRRSRSLYDKGCDDTLISEIKRCGSSYHAH